MCTLRLDKKWVHMNMAKTLNFHEMQGIFLLIDNLSAGPISFARMTLLHGISQLNFLSSASLWKDIKSIYNVEALIRPIKVIGLLHAFPVR
jgi:hypothetical protein